jgi:hypothetical protein
MKLKEATEGLEDLQRLQDSHLSEDLAVTSRMMRLVYFETLANIPFLMHSLTVQVQVMHGINLGNHHNNPDGAVRMVDLISKTMQRDLLNELIKNRPTISLQIDGATDKMNNHFMICFLSFQQHGQLITVFYRLLPICVSENAVALFNLIVDAFVDDGIEDYMKSKLVSFISDGAAVLSSASNSVSARFRKWITPPNRRLIKVHCCPHRLQLALNHSFKKSEIVSDIEQFLSDIASYFYGASHKRKAHIQKLAFYLGKKLYRFDNFFNQRWIASEYKAIIRVINSYDLVVEDLRQISINSLSEFDLISKKRAINLLERLKRKNLTNILFFFG